MSDTTTPTDKNSTTADSVAGPKMSSTAATEQGGRDLTSEDIDRMLQMHKIRVARVDETTGMVTGIHETRLIRVGPVLPVA